MNIRRGRVPREELIADLFGEHHQRILSMVERRVTPVHHAADGCSYAWGRLLEHREVKIDDQRALGWVFQAALRESWRLAGRERGEQPLDKPTKDGEGLEAHEVVPDRAPGPHEHAVMREKLALVDELPRRRQQALMMSAVGYSYDEINQRVGMSYTSVNRYLTEGRAKLRGLDHQRSQTPTERQQTATTVTPEMAPTRKRQTPTRARQQPELDLGIEL